MHKLLKLVILLLYVFCLIGCDSSKNSSNAVVVNEDKVVTIKSQKTESNESKLNTDDLSNTSNDASINVNSSEKNLLQGDYSKSTSSVPIKDGVAQLKFKDLVSFEELKYLDGKKVAITGFISPISPLDGSYIYIINIPYQTCVFCVPNDAQLTNTMAVYPKDGKSFKFIDTPVTVTGTLLIDNTVDSLGYSYNYRIINASYSKADVSGLEETIQIYTDIVDKGFAIKFVELINELYEVLNYEKVGLDVESLKVIDKSKVYNLRKMFDGLNKDDYKDLLSILDSLETVIDDVNSGIESKDYSNFNNLNAECQDIYNMYYSWLIRPQI